MLEPHTGTPVSKRTVFINITFIALGDRLNFKIDVISISVVKLLMDLIKTMKIFTFSHLFGAPHGRGFDKKA